MARHIDQQKAIQVTQLTMKIANLEDEIASFSHPRKGKIKALKIQIAKLLEEVDQVGLPFEEGA